MRIALHAGTLRGFGSSIVGRAIVRELPRLAEPDTVVAWVPREWNLEARALRVPIDLRKTKPGLGRKLLTENLWIRRALHRHGIDVLFSLGDTSLPACPRPHLLLVQQAFLAYDPDEWGFSAPCGFVLRMRAMTAYLRAALPTVTRVTVQTRHMKDRFAERFAYPAERISVIASGLDLDVVDPAAPRPSVGAPYVCCVATGGPHKNHVVLADMMAALRRQYPTLLCRLTVTPREVPALTAAASQRGVNGAFVFEGRVSEARATDLLRGAVSLVMPSKLESFGFPYYEAMAAGCPIVASDLPFAREACGELGLYARPDDGEHFAEHVGRLLSEQSSAQSLSARLRERVTAICLPWSEVASRYNGLLREVAQDA